MEYIWYDKQHNPHDIRVISDRYLLNIVRHVSKGGGYDVSDELIRAIFEEANRRNLKHKFRVGTAINAWRGKRWAQEEQYLNFHC